MLSRLNCFLQKMGYGKNMPEYVGPQVSRNTYFNADTYIWVYFYDHSPVSIKVWNGYLYLIKLPFPENSFQFEFFCKSLTNLENLEGRVNSYPPPNSFVYFGGNA